MQHWIWVAALALGTNVALADEVNGLLEKGKNGSMIYEVSPESGDVIAYYFSHHTPAGAKVKADCIDGMYCHVHNMTTEENNALKTEFSDPVSVTFVVKGDAEVSMGSAFDSYDQAVSTRFGDLVIDDEHALRLNNRPVTSPINVNNGLSVAFSTEMDDQDIVVLRNAGGTGCPELFTVMRISAKGYQFSPEFGTCSPYAMVSFDKQGNLKIDMTDFMGPSEPESAQRAAFLKKVGFVYRKDGKLIEPAKK